MPGHGCRPAAAGALAPVLLVTLAAATQLGCGTVDPEDVARGTLSAYFSAIQTGQDEQVLDLLADGEVASGSGLAELRQDVADQRAAGEYRFDHPWGLGLVQAFVLGRGGYWQVVEARGEEERVVAHVLLRTQYGPEETRGLPPEAVVEYLVEPVGRVRRLARGDRSPGGLRRELVELTVEAELAWQGEAWRLVRLEPVVDSAVYRDVTWRPE